jgi:beta-xylosidase
MVIVGLLATGLGIAAQVTGTYTNPVYNHDFPDPHVIRWGDRYFAYGTQTRNTGFQLLESPDLVHWTPRVLEFPIPWAKEHYWAPEVVESHGTFYLTYSALDPATRKHDIAIATAEKSTGPFEHRAILVRGDDNRVGVIDATIAFDGDVPYLIYSEESPRRIVARRLRSDLLGTEGDPIELIRPDRPWERGVTEAPTLVKRNGVYHLFYSGAGFQGSKDDCRYAVGHAAARSLEGPYLKAAEPVLKTVEGQVYGPGHQCVVQTPDGSWWMLYHGWNAEGQPHYGQNPVGRSLRIDRLTWDGDVPRVEGPTVGPTEGPPRQ